MTQNGAGAEHACLPQHPVEKMDRKTDHVEVIAFDRGDKQACGTLYSVRAGFFQRISRRHIPADLLFRHRGEGDGRLFDANGGFSAYGDGDACIDQVLSALELQGEEAQAPIAVGGRSNLLSYPEYSDVAKAQNFLSALESREKLYPLLRAKGGVEFTVRIGPENEVPEMKDCSVITASYRVSDRSTGTMAIIGPTRMNYNRTISVLQYVGRELSDLLSDR